MPRRRSTGEVAAEEDLVLRWQSGDRSAGSALVAMHRGFVRSVAKRYRGRGLEAEDLCQEGALGLLRAAMVWERERGAALITYAFFHVRAAMLTAIRRGRLMRRGGVDLTLDEQVFEDGDVTRLDNIPAEGPVADEQAAEGEELDDAATAALEALSPREREVVQRHAAGETLEEIGDGLDLTRERVRQLEARALEKLRGHVRRGRARRQHAAQAAAYEVREASR